MARICRKKKPKKTCNNDTSAFWGRGGKAVRDEGYFWKRVTGLDTHHQTAVLALKHRAMCASFNVPRTYVASQTRKREVGVVTVVTASLFTCRGNGYENNTG